MHHDELQLLYIALAEINYNRIEEEMKEILSVVSAASHIDNGQVNDMILIVLESIAEN